MHLLPAIGQRLRRPAIIGRFGQVATINRHPMPTVICIETGLHRERVLEARNALVEAHLHLVPDIAGRIHSGLPPSFDLDDLISEGNIGLIQAATRYRPSAHNRTPFSAFARPRIRGAIIDSVRRRRYTDNTAYPLSPQLANSRRLSQSNTAEASVDEATALRRLDRAMTWLPRSKQRLLQNLYCDRIKPRPTAAFKRRKDVIEIHPVALAQLKIEFRRAA
jgi:RNA polymerase sigma factor (sigma-70 family)